MGLTSEADAKAGIVRFTPQERSPTAGQSSRWGMMRKLRVEYPETMHPVVNRRDRREPIVRDDADRERFVEPLVPAGLIAERARMGSAGNVNTLPGHCRRDGQK